MVRARTVVVCQYYSPQQLDKEWGSTADKRRRHQPTVMSYEPKCNDCADALSPLLHITEPVEKIYIRKKTGTFRYHFIQFCYSVFAVCTAAVSVKFTFETVQLSKLRGPLEVRKLYFLLYSFSLMHKRSAFSLASFFPPVSRRAKWFTRK